MTTSNEAGHLPLRLAYAAVSAALLLPVLAWPLFWWSDAALNTGMEVGEVWIIAAATLLICAVTADSLLYYRPHDNSVLFAVLWVLNACLAASVALRSENGAYMLAVVFALHTARSGIRLWRGGDSAWWLWPAWARDTLASAGLFFWLVMISDA